MRRLNSRGGCTSRSAKVNVERLETRVLLNALSETGILSGQAAFIRNDGQWTDESVRYALDGDGADVLACDGSLRILASQDADAATGLRTAPREFSMTLSGARVVAPVASGMLPGRTSYFIGDTPRDWVVGAPSFSEIAYENVYEGVDLVLWGSKSEIKYEFRLDPWADPGVVRVDLGGIDSMSLDAGGNLRIAVGDAEFADLAPFVYQEAYGKKTKIEARYKLIDADSWGIEVVGDYDPSQSLILDPAIAWSSYLGGGDYDSAQSIAVDGSGNVYVTGVTDSVNFPTDNGFDTSNSGFRDAFVTKISSDGSTILWSAYLGGSGGSDQGYGIAVDGTGNVYVAGVTDSGDFPGLGGFDTTLGGGQDGFVAKILSDGSGIAWSNFLGGIGNDEARDIALDASGNIYVTGITQSGDFPAVNGFDASLGGAQDAFVTKIANDGTAIIWSSYLGGTSYEEGIGLAVGGDSSVYVTGNTMSGDFSTNGGFQTSYGGGQDGFVTKVSPAGNSLAWSSYLGGGSADYGEGVAVDGAGNAYVTGYTQSGDFPSSGGFDATLGGSQDAFITKVAAAGSSLAWSSYLGGSGSEKGRDLALDGSGNIFLTGETDSSDFPTANPVDGTLGGGRDAYMTKVAADGSAISFSTYIGGDAGNEYGRDVAVLTDAYITGDSWSDDLRTDYGFDQSYNGNGDAFVMRITAGNLPPRGTIDSPADGATTYPGGTINLLGSGFDPNGTIASWDWQVTGPNSFSWSSTDEDPGLLALPDLGDYTITLTVTDNEGAPDESPEVVTAQVRNNPDGTIDSPLDGAVVFQGGSIDLLGTGYDSDGTVVAWDWQITGPSGFTWSSSVEDPGLLSLPNLGEYSITLTVTDNTGLEDPVPAAATVALRARPNGTITSPTNGLVIQPGENIDLQSSWTDADGTVTAWDWQITGPNGFTWSSSVEDPGTLTLSDEGAYAITLTVTDNHGYADLTPAQTGVVVNKFIFENVTGASGLDTSRLGVGVADITGDGIIDVVMTGESGEMNHAWFGDGDMTFTDPGSVGIENQEGHTPSFADYDNDGDTDLAVGWYWSGGSGLYRNAGTGTFTDVSGSSGVGDPDKIHLASWADVNNDGWPDLAFARNGANMLFLNNGNGTFTDQAAARGMNQGGYGIAVIFGDIDRDGDSDAYATIDGGTNNRLLRNNGTGYFTDVTDSSGASGVFGGSQHPMFADYDNDGDLDLFQTGPGLKLLANDGRGYFTDVTSAAGLGGAGTSPVGVMVTDLDNDGYQDLMVSATTGSKLYLGAPSGVFLDSTANEPMLGVGRPITFGDFDRDGDVDVLQVHATPTCLLENLTDDGRMLTVAADGLTTSRSGIGTQLSLYRLDGSEWELVGYREIFSGYGRTSGNPLEQYFALPEDGTYKVMAQFVNGSSAEHTFAYSGAGPVNLTLNPEGYAPQSVIDSPLDGLAIDPGQSINLQGSGSDADGSIITWRWEISGPNGFAWSSTSEDPGSLQLNDFGKYTITLTTIDDDGFIDQTPARATVWANFAPSITVDAPASNLIKNPGQVARIAFTAADPDNAAAISLYYDTDTNPDNGKTLITSALVEGTDTYYDWTIPANYGATYYVYALISDGVSSVGDYGPATVHVNSQPNGVIDSPLSGSIVKPGQSINLTSSWTDDGAVTGWNWQITGPSGFTWSSSNEDPGLLQLNTEGVYTVTLTVTDDLGLADPTPAQVSVEVTDRIFTNVYSNSGLTSYWYGFGIEDINGDGILDLVPSKGGTDYRLFLGNGDLTFAAQQNMGFEGDPAHGAYFGDYDNDGDRDIYETWAFSSSYLFRNQGDGHVVNANSSSGIGSPSDLQVATWADLNADGWTDLTLAGTTTKVFINNHNGTFTNQTSQSGLSGTAHEIIYGDLDRDGDLDAFKNDWSGNGALYLNNGTGSFTNATSSSGGPGVFSGPKSAALADYNNDGYLDLILNGSYPKVLRNDGSAYFVDVTNEVGLSGITCADGRDGLMVADFNNDGWQDLFLCVDSGSRVFLGGASGVFTEVTSNEPALGESRIVSYGDLDRDGDVDVVASAFEQVTNPHRNTFKLLRNDTNDGRLLTVRADGLTTMRDGIGTGISLYREEAGQWEFLGYREIFSGFGSYSGNPLEAYFALPDDGNYKVQGRFVNGQVGDYEFAYSGAAPVSITLNPEGFAPVIAINSPTDGSDIDIHQSINLQATGTDSDGAIVSWFWNITGPNGFSWTSTAEDPGLLQLDDPGEYVVTLTAEDDDGFLNALPAIAVVDVIDHGPVVTDMTPEGPVGAAVDEIVVEFNEALNVASAQSAANYILTGSLDHIFGNADDSDLSGMIQSIVYSDGGGAGPFEVTITLSAPLDEGAYRLTIDGNNTVTDAAGNSLNDGADEVRSFAVDAISPTVTIDLQPGSDSGASDTDNITNDNTPTYDITVNESGTIEVDYDGDGTPETTMVLDSAGTYEISVGMATGSFQTQQTFAVGTNPYNVESGDLDKDGALDLIVANVASNNLSLLMGNGDGTFQAQQNYAMGTSPHALIVVDLNADGNLDVATGNVTGVVAVRLGNGDGTLGTMQTYSTGSESRSITAADFNGDTILDLATGDKTNNRVSVFIGNGDGTFQSQLTYAVGTYPLGICSGDFNGDGRQDIATANDSTDNVSVLIGNGNGTFQSAVNYAAGDQPRHVISVDLDGDSDLDLVTANWWSRDVSVLLGNGNGTFQTQIRPQVGYGPRVVVSTDANNDGIADLAVACASDDVAALLIGNGNGTFQTYQTFATGDYPDCVCAGDFNGDGASDIVLGNDLANNVSVLLGEIAELSDGAYPFTVTFTDSAANVVTDSDPTTVDTVGPEVSGMVPPPATNAAVGQIVLTFNEALDPATAEDLADYQLLASGGDGAFGDGNEVVLDASIQTIVYADGGGAGPFTVTLTLNPVLSDESYQLTIDGDSSVKDIAGNVLNNGSDEVRTFLIDTIPPTVTIDLQPGSDSGASDSDNVTNDNTPTYDVTVSEAGTLEIDLDGDGTPDRTIVINAAGTYEVDLFGDQDGFITFDGYLGGSNPSGIAGGDINGDGHADLVSTDNGSAQISVYLNRGDGTFEQRAAYAAGSSPNGVAIGDLNGDGVGDVVVGASVSSQARACVFLSNGDGTLQPYQSYAVGGTAAGCVICVDLNADGKLDLAGTNNSGDQVGVLRGNGDGTFQGAQLYTVGDGPYCVFSADLDGDSKNDLVTANGNSDNISVLKGNGDGTFQAQQTYATGDLPMWVAGGDLDGDLRVDLVVSNAAGNSISVLLNNGDGTFGAKTDYPAANTPRGVVVTDVDSDGIADVAVSTKGSSSILLFPGNGDGTLDVAERLGTGESPNGLFAGDLDGDSLPDLAAACSGDSDEVAVLLTEGTTGFRTYDRVLLSDSPLGMIAVDLNLDGNLDIVGALYYESVSSLSVLLGNGDGSFGGETLLPVAGMSSDVVSADFNNDAVPDLAATNYNGNTVSVLMGRGDGSFDPYQTSIVNNGPLGLYCDDLDKDGNQDIIASNSNGLNLDGNTVSVLLGNGDGSFQPQITLTVGQGPTTVVAADFNNDGISDIATCNMAGQTITLLPGNGDGTFQTALTCSMPSGIGLRLRAADFDKDGNLDIAVSGEELLVLLGNGDGTFQTEFSVCSETIDVAVGDFDCDGNADLLASEYPFTSHATPSIFLVRGNGDGTFEPVESYSIGTHTSVAAGDLNGDGKMDAIVGGEDSSIGIILARSGPLADGIYPVNVTFTDAGGNVGTDSDPTTIDTEVPESVIEQPSGDVKWPEDTPYDFAGSGDEAATTSPLSFAWDFGGGAANSSEQNPTATFNTVGTYTVSLTVSDLAGNVDPTPATVQFTAVRKPNPGYNGPVLIIPDMVEVMPARDHYTDWVESTPYGIAPDWFDTENTLTRAYDPLLASLQAPGVDLVMGVDCFVAAYDWRLSFAPDDGVADGHLATGLNDADATYEYAVEYLRYWIDAAKTASGWDTVTLIGHGTGGILARAYMQSDLYDGDVSEVVMVGAPNHGEPSAYAQWQGRFGIGEDLDLVRGAMLNQLYHDHERNPIPGIDPAATDIEFAQAFMPSLKDIIPTYAFLVRENINDTPLSSNHNTFLRDLNADLDGLLQPGVDAATISQTGLDTPSWVIVKNNGKYKLANDVDGDSIVARDAAGIAGSVLTGVTDYAVSAPGMSHKDMLEHDNVQAQVFALLGYSAPAGGYSHSGIRLAGEDIADVTTFSFDPVDFIVTDDSGNRSGYDAANGLLDEIPNSWFSGDDARELLIILNGASPDYQVDLTGTGDDYIASAGGFTHGGGETFYDLSGNLPLGQTRTDNVSEIYRPDGTMVTPAEQVFIEPGQSVYFAGQVSDPDDPSGHFYQWNFDGAAPMSTVLEPGNVQFNGVGVYYVQFTVTDPYGNVDETPDIVMVNVIITNPTAPGRLDLSAGSDSGVSDSDDITNDNTPTFTWTASSDMSGIAGYWWAVDDATPETGGAFTTELTATLPAIADGSHTLYVKAVDATPAGYLSDASAIPFTVDTIGANVQQWQSKQTHGAAGEITTVIANGWVESRYAGIRKLVIDLDENADPASVGVGDLSVVGVKSGNQSGLISSVTASGDKVTVQLSAALPDIDTYTITLGQDVRDVAGNQMSGPKQITVKALRGDANGDGQVNSFDLLNIRVYVGQAINAANARCDINGDGVINSFDQLMARVYVGNKIT